MEDQAVLKWLSTSIMPSLEPGQGHIEIDTVSDTLVYIPPVVPVKRVRFNFEKMERELQEEYEEMIQLLPKSVPVIASENSFRLPPLRKSAPVKSPFEKLMDKRSFTNVMEAQEKIDQHYLAKKEQIKKLRQLGLDIRLKNKNSAGNIELRERNREEWNRKHNQSLILAKNKHYQEEKKYVQRALASTWAAKKEIARQKADMENRLVETGYLLANVFAATVAYRFRERLVLNWEMQRRQLIVKRLATRWRVKTKFAISKRLAANVLRWYLHELNVQAGLNLVIRSLRTYTANIGKLQRRWRQRIVVGEARLELLTILFVQYETSILNKGQKVTGRRGLASRGNYGASRKSNRQKKAPIAPELRLQVLRPYLYELIEKYNLQYQEYQQRTWPHLVQVIYDSNVGMSRMEAKQIATKHKRNNSMCTAIKAYCGGYDEVQYPVFSLLNAPVIDLYHQAKMFVPAFDTSRRPSLASTETSRMTGRSVASSARTEIMHY